MRSLDAWAAFRCLLGKEWRELLASRSWWLLLLLLGPLTGVSFSAAVQAYAEVSGLNGTAAGVGEALAPLIGVWAPAFSACELAAVFLLPFVAIRMVGGDRQSGAVKLELQRPNVLAARIAAKAAVALLGWLIAMLPATSAIPLWLSYGGHMHAPEMLTLVAGHILNGGLTIALGAAAATLAEHPSSAAILTLAVTVGTWIIHFFSAVQGGLWERAAAFTPSALVAGFQRGLLRLDVLLAGVILILTGLALAFIGQRQGVRAARRAVESAAAVAVAAVALLGAAQVRANWDFSENRANSFPLADERALRRIREPVRIVAHLAPEDPRRADLERNAFGKLRRILPAVTIEYQSSTSIGIFEQSRPDYGEIWYEVGGRKEMSRVTTAEGVLEAIYGVAAVHAPADVAEPVFRGHPLAVPPRGAAAIFYGFWPGLIVLAGLWVRGRGF